jgi:hypothetical protein
MFRDLEIGNSRDWSRQLGKLILQSSYRVKSARHLQLCLNAYIYTENENRVDITRWNILPKFQTDILNI